MSVEIFDAEFELALSISPRSTCRFTKKLEERGYIKKEVRGTSQNKLANIYTLIDVEVNNTPTDSLCNDINKDAQKFPLTDDANIDGSSDGSSDGRIGILKNNIKINKKNNIFLSNNINIPDTDIDNINVDNTDEVFLSNFVKVDNINVDNSNEGIKNLRIEIKNINNENVMNEERMNEMNNINSNENDINTSTKSLEDILTEQSDEFNSIIQFMNNSVIDTDEVNTSNKSMNNSVEEQKRYQRLFNKCKSQIEIWMKTHEYSCISMFDAYFEAIQDMKENNLISVKQWNAAQRYLFQRFNKLRIGYNNYIQKKNKTISSNEVNELITPDPHGNKNDQMEEVV
ncbi:MAG: hypothetical protein MSC51_01155 [Mollicutes bacterium]|nr:hypothetical protein [Mollicutes bacterium]